MSLKAFPEMHRRPTIKSVTTAFLLHLLLLGAANASDVEEYDSYKKAISRLTPQTSTVEDAKFIGSPYGLRVWTVGGVRFEERKFPTAEGEFTTLLFRDGKLDSIGVTPDSFAVIHRGPMYPPAEAKKRSAMKSLDLGWTAEMVNNALGEPGGVLSEHEVDQILRNNPTSRMLRGETWSYWVGDIALDVVMSGGRVIGIVETVLPSKRQLRKIMEKAQKKHF